MDLPPLSLDLQNLRDLAAHAGEVGAITPDVVWASLVSAAATLALALAFTPRRPSAHAGALLARGASTICEFLVDGSAVQPLGEPARALLDSLGPAPSRLAALRRHLSRDCTAVQGSLEALVLYGTAFHHHCVRPDGTALEITGTPEGAAARLTIRPASEQARALKDAERALDRAQAESRFLRAALDRAPVLAWSIAPDGTVRWANAAYRDRFANPDDALPDHRLQDAFGHVLEEVPLTSRDGGARRRVSIPGPRETEAHWFEISQCAGPDGETLGFALAADDLVAAEASLRRFIETLTETFAHLPIGLAVFDKNRRLGLFNPALTDLVKIDAVWLAGRPSLRDFLERLRETRQMPEQKDFAAWRRKLGELEEGARDGTYEENWVLPSGKIFRVTGRPHPQGALAFLFEDISGAVQLERRYRAELELSQATLDRMSEAVAVFDTSGQLVFVNAAFEALWGFDPMDRLDGPGVVELAALWAERCRPDGAWDRLREFATAADARTSWATGVETLDGRRIDLLVAPLPDASTLVVFRANAGAGAGDGSEIETRIADLARDRIERPAEAAVRSLTDALPAAPSPEAFRTLAASLQALKDGLAQARALRALEAGDGEGSGGPAARLGDLLASRGLGLDLTGIATAPAARRALWALALAAADLAAPGATVRIVVAAMPAVSELTARVPRGPAPGSEGAGPETPGLALARRVFESLSGVLDIEETPDGSEALLRARLPSALDAAEPPALSA
jgi:PAS domain-containing protein